ncbi:hypothetical protein Dip518_001345 [Parelusimicrobium proximum]|uniref:GNAT family N-acetyltransferase n=1 Tax=Parelusimicrobium proximum TaxID=3228953 RepID=UPI003D184EE0
MNKNEKIRLAKEILAKEWNCGKDAFDQQHNVIIESPKTFLDIISFGPNAVVLCSTLIYEWCVKHLSNVPPQKMLDGSFLFMIETKLREYDHKLSGQNLRYLFLDPDKNVKKPKEFEYKTFDAESVKELYGGKYVHALNYKTDVLAVAACKDGDIIALAGADNTIKEMWQIGVETDSGYRSRGVGAYLVKTLAGMIEKNGAMAFYTTRSSNLLSTNAALNSGFIPVWINYYAIPADPK